MHVQGRPLFITEGESGVSRQESLGIGIQHAHGTLSVRTQQGARQPLSSDGPHPVEGDRERASLPQCEGVPSSPQAAWEKLQDTELSKMQVTGKYGAARSPSREDACPAAPQSLERPEAGKADGPSVTTFICITGIFYTHNVFVHFLSIFSHSVLKLL